MDSHKDEFAPAIDRLLADIRQRENEVLERKRMVNALCEMASRPLLFHDIEADRKSISAIKGDQFVGKPLQTVVGDYLLMRGDSSKGGIGAATVNEIFDGLLAGGYEFDAKDAQNAKRGLRISLTKNSSKFYRVPNGRYGLLVWYPNAKAQSTAARAAKNGSKAETAPPEDSAHEQDDETGEKQTTDEGGAQSSAA